VCSKQDLYFFTLSEYYPKDYAMFNWCVLEAGRVMFLSSLSPLVPHGHTVIQPVFATAALAIVRQASCMVVEKTGTK